MEELVKVEIADLPQDIVYTTHFGCCFLKVTKLGSGNAGGLKSVAREICESRSYL